MTVKTNVKVEITATVEFKEAVQKYPEMKKFNEHLQFVNMCIAERIGKKNL